MPQQTMISVKMDKSLKVAAQKTAGDLGFQLGTLINAYLRQLVRDKAVNLSIAETPSKRLREAIASADAEYRTGKVRKFMSADAFLADLEV